MMGAVKKSSGSHNAVAMTSDGPRQRGGRGGGGRQGRDEKTERGRNKQEGLKGKENNAGEM